MSDSLRSPRPPRAPRRLTLDPHLIARATREQRAPVTAHLAGRPPATPGLIAYQLLGPTPPRKEPA